MLPCLGSRLRDKAEPAFRSEDGDIGDGNTTGEKRRFGNIVEAAQWATANAIGSESAEWPRNGEKLAAGSGEN